MPSGRTKYDAAFFRRRTSSSANGNSIHTESKNGFHAPTGNAKRFYSSPVEEHENNKDRYLITYADLITLLLGLFIILYASSNLDLIKYQKLISTISTTLGGTSGEKVKPPVPLSKNIGSDLKSKISSMAAVYGYKDFLRVEENERGVTIHIIDDILFSSGAAEIKTSSGNILEKLAGILKTIPNDIRIEGHTDDVPIHSQQFPSNWHLSVNRAVNTAYYLINVQNLPPERVSVVGYSEFRPVADNSTNEGKKMNRRVDIVIIK